MKLSFEDIEFLTAIMKKLTEEEQAALYDILSKISWLEGFRAGVVEGVKLQKEKP